MVSRYSIFILHHAVLGACVVVGHACLDSEAGTLRISVRLHKPVLPSTALGGGRGVAL